MTSLADEYSGEQYIFDENSVKALALSRVSGKCLKRESKIFSKETRRFLESVFERKKSLNPKEREVVGAACGLTPTQVRVWVCILFCSLWINFEYCGTNSSLVQ